MYSSLVHKSASSTGSKPPLAWKALGMYGVWVYKMLRDYHQVAYVIIALPSALL